MRRQVERRPVDPRASGSGLAIASWDARRNDRNKYGQAHGRASQSGRALCRRRSTFTAAVFQYGLPDQFRHFTLGTAIPAYDSYGNGCSEVDCGESGFNIDWNGYSPDFGSHSSFDTDSDSFNLQATSSLVLH